MDVFEVTLRNDNKTNTHRDTHIHTEINITFHLL